MGEIRIVGPGKTRGYPYPVYKNIRAGAFIRKIQYVGCTASLVYYTRCCMLASVLAVPKSLCI